MGLKLGRCATRTHEDVTLHQQHAESNKGTKKKQFKDKKVKIERERKRKRQTDRHSEKKRSHSDTWRHG